MHENVHVHLKTLTFPKYLNYKCYWGNKMKKQTKGRSLSFFPHLRTLFTRVCVLKSGMLKYLIS